MYKNIAIFYQKRLRKKKCRRYKKRNNGQKRKYKSNK